MSKHLGNNSRLDNSFILHLCRKAFKDFICKTIDYIEHKSTN